MFRTQVTTLLILSLWFSQAIGQASPNKTLYILSLFSYPDSNPSLAPAKSDGLTIVKGARFAVDRINNASLVSDYTLELIEADDGCNVSWKGVANLINSLYYSDKKVVAIIGPQCSDSAAVVGSITGRPQVALLNIHLASSYALSNRSLYPYSFGINIPSFYTVDAFGALIDRNNWTRIGVLYDLDLSINYNSYQLFIEAVKGKAELAFTSSVSLTYIPLTELNNTYVRVIVSFLQNDIQKSVLCLAYHKNMIYPRYQWVLFNSIDSSNVSFVYGDVSYKCNKNQMDSALYRSVSASTRNVISNDLPVSGIEFYDLSDTCVMNANCYEIFDVVWALALAINNSLSPLKEKGLSLSDYSYGKYYITNIFRQELLKLTFSGIDQTVKQFDPNTGYPSPATLFTDLLQVGAEGYAVRYQNGTLTFNDEVNSSFITTSFDQVHLPSVSLPLAWVVVAVVVVAVLLLVLIHTLNTVCCNVASIKASSSKLNHFAYLGCYLVLVAELLYAGVEMTSASIRTKTVLCNAFPWCLVLGLTMLFSTVLVKTLRLYYIFAASIKGKRSKVIWMNDSCLAAIIIGFVVTSAVLLTAWTASDPFVRVIRNGTVPSGDTLVIVIKDFCHNNARNHNYWIAAVITCEMSLITACTVFAFLNRKVTLKEFQTHSVILLAYILAMSSFVGVVAYFITANIGEDQSLPFGIVCLVLSVTVYLCIFLLFLPPVLPAIGRICIESTNRRQFPSARI